MKNNGNLKHISLFFAATAILTAIFYFSGCISKEKQDTEIKQSEPSRIPADYESLPKPIIVAVIDTGFDFQSNWKVLLKSYPTLKMPRLCKFGHKDFTGTGLSDRNGHGTHIAGIIAQQAFNENYCIVVIKYFDPSQNYLSTDNLEQTRKSFELAINLKVKIINYSGGGEERSEAECLLIKKALDAGIVVVAAAGNEKNNINKNPYYPAMCDSRVRAVANIDRSGQVVPSSNFTDNSPKSRFLYKEMGNQVLSIIPNNQIGFMTGTSQAAAVETGKVIVSMKKP